MRRPFETSPTPAGSAFTAALVLLALTACEGDRREQDADPAFLLTRFLHETLDGDLHFPPALEGGGVDQGLLYGRVTADDGTVYEGRLRFGGDEEALWGNTFDGARSENPWIAWVPTGHLPKERAVVEVFGIEFGATARVSPDRPFMARFGDIARIEPHGRDVRVTLKSGSGFHIDRFGADDLADGVRVWDRTRGVVDLGEWDIRSIELLPAVPSGDASPAPLYGTVHTGREDFTGFIQWDRKACLDSDELVGHATDGEVRVPFDSIRSITRRARDSSSVTLRDGRRITLGGTREVGRENRGIYVDDPRYGRLLVSWDAFEGLDLASGGTGPAYGDFPAGRPLTGNVVTRSGRRLAGRLVYDLDESETTETLDAPWHGVDYMLPFGLVASIELPGPGEHGARGARVTLRSGKELELELAGDLGERNAGMLVFVPGRPDPEYVPWNDVERVSFQGPS